MPIVDVTMGKDVVIPHPDLVNLYGCTIEDNVFIGPFVEIQSDVVIGANSRIQSHSFICSKTRIGKNVFVGHGVMFINDRYPVQRDAADWEETIIKDTAVVGNNATVLPCTIGEKAMVAAGAVVTKDVPAGMIAAGNPAKILGTRA